MKIKFREVKLSPPNRQRLDVINDIIEEYQNQGLVLTLRQLYYQLVSRDVIPNRQTEYSKLSTLLKEGRMGGIVDWEATEDRLRVPYTPTAFETPTIAMQALINQYEVPRMKDQKNYVEVWVEKDALSGVLRRVTSKYHVPILVNRGYSSASAMFDSYVRFARALKQFRKCYILYLGDFDPSGQDMIRDIRERTLEFLLNDKPIEYMVNKLLRENTKFRDKLIEKYNGVEELCIVTKDKKRFFDPDRAWIIDHFEVVPIALTKEQIEQYDPPENPAKRTDPRAEKFIEQHGTSSWEVDALRPDVLNTLLTNAIEERIDIDLYNGRLKKEKVDLAVLTKLKKSI